MDQLETIVIQCPYCWEQIEITVDTSAPRQEYVEDCQICCRPILITVETENREIRLVNAQAENE